VALKSSGKKKRPEPSRLSARRLWIFRLTALLLPLVLLGLLEIGLRVAGYGFDPHFFKPLKIGGKDYFVQNDDFSFSFFPKETARNPGVFRMEAVKPPGAFRIFVFGESAAMGDPEPAYGPARYLEAQLREKFPDTKFEVINAAFTAINSHVIVPIARECARHDGDLWIIYMGNNEMVGPFGAATVFGRRAPPLPYVRLVTAAQRTRTGQLFTALARRLHPGKAPATSWGGMQMFLNNQISPGSPLKENVYRNFQQNLADIIRAGLGSGAKILLNTVAVNLEDCPPFASLTNGSLPSADRAQFEKFYSAAQSAETQGNVAAAAQLYELAGKLDGTCADLQYRWGRCLLAQQSFSEAREHLQRACDDDALPFRTDARLNQLIRATGEKIGGDQLVCFDAAAALAADKPAKICGVETFYEHVHFDFNGSYRLGLAWAEQVEKLLPPNLPRSARAWLSEAACGDRLGLSDWNRAAVLEHMAGRLAVPPFSSQPNDPWRVTGLEARDRQLQARMDTNDLAAARENFQKQLEKSPDDFLLRENFALFLQAAGNLPQAIAEWRRVHDLIPHDYLPFFQMGRLLGAQGRSSEAEADLRAALNLHPSLTEGWFELGNVLAAEGKFADALASYAAARAQRPQDAQTVVRIGKVHLLLNQHAEAVQCFREAVKFNPADWEAHYELGGELDAAGQLEAARDEFAAAVKLKPGYSRAHFNYGALLAKQGRLAEAQREFAEALRQEPDYKNAQDSLAKVQRLLQPRPKN
jgi:tetratricopeptide (TPR) repeat protein